MNRHFTGTMVAASPRFTAASGTTVKRVRAPRQLDVHFARIGIISMIVALGALLGAMLGLAVAPARAHAEGAHASTATPPTTPKRAPIRAAASAPAAPSAPAVEATTVHAPTKTGLAASPARAKNRPGANAPLPSGTTSAIGGKKSEKRPPSTSQILGAGLRS